MIANHIEKLLLHQEKRLLQQETRKSVKEINSMLADTFFEIGSSGRVFNKQQIIEGLQTESPSIYKLENFKTFDLAPDVVLVTYRVSRLNDLLEQAPAHSLRSSIWKFIDGQWQMVFHQGTLSAVLKKD
jgi:hypothetical protein